MSSACGLADVLESVGVRVPLEPEQVVRCVERCGLAFMFAPVNHPAMRFVAPVRNALGVRTCFNSLRPMTNAAGAQMAVIRVFRDHLIPLMIGVLKKVGRVDHAVVIHGVGLDDISPMGRPTIIDVSAELIAGSSRLWFHLSLSSSLVSLGSDDIPASSYLLRLFLVNMGNFLVSFSSFNK